MDASRMVQTPTSSRQHNVSCLCDSHSAHSISSTDVRWNCQWKHTHIHNRFTALWILSQTTRVSRYQKKHSPTHTHCGHQSSLSASSIGYDPRHPLCSIYVPDSLFPQSLFKCSLVYLLAWHPPLHTPYISSPSHYLLFAAQAHTTLTCFAVVLRLCHLPEETFTYKWHNYQII